MTFDINSAGDKKDYFGRFLSLSFVIGIRLSVFAIIIGTPTAIVFSLLDRNFDIDENLKDFLGLGLFTGFGILYYFILTNSFKKVNQ
jgi:ABC-type spermidine/putrescine transport system permease subunit II